ncbi:hypothetical protein H9X96_05265 [Pedobacter sp. N36a]|uniref:hypothetical protein n=1 Tax=Pedobacter sp. N36a TaxID=2767996 RepID=UPI0016568FEE|nr:hypothetical protein [Pedobacter sp. N36a]MBC8985180.1 hypothetical protein [Pedobacter sp. N36a]
MKKIILSAAFLAFASITAVNASEVKSPVAINLKQDSTTKVPVELKDLPEAVKTTLQSEPVKAWTPSTAFLVTNADKTQYFEIAVKKDAETAVIKIGADGKIIQ